MNDKMKGCIYGLFVADAVATPYEFRNEDYMNKLSAIDMIPPQGHHRTYKDVKTGTWSDEGSMTLAMMDTIVHCHGFKPKYFLRNLMQYKYEGAFCVNQYAFGYSRHLEQMLRAHKEGTPVYSLDEAKKSRDTDSLVRSVPLVLMDVNCSAKQTIELAHKQALVTNMHPITGICSAIYMQWIKNIVRKENNPFVKSVHQLFELYNSELRQMIILEILQHKPVVGVNDIAECLMDTYEIICKTSTYHEAVIEAVRKGNHSTSLASSVGAIAGLIYGYRAIPQKWLDGLRSREMIDELVNEYAKEIKDEEK